MRRSLGLVPVLAVVAVAGCGGSGGGPPEGGWPSADDLIDTSGLVYASGDTVRLGDGSELAVGEPVERFVLAGSGVYFVADGHDALRYSTGDGSSREVAPDASELLASADGRYLMFLDMESGKEDGFGTPQAEVVVVDAVAGDELARSSEGMGDPDSDADLADLYEDAEPGLLGFRDGEALYDGVGDDVVIDLGTGEVSVRAEVPDLIDPGRSPDGRWTIVDVYRGYAPHDRLVTAAGRNVPLTGVPSTVGLQRWIGETVVAGYALDGRANGQGLTPGSTLPLITCDATTGRCEVVPGPTADQVRLPEGAIS